VHRGCDGGRGGVDGRLQARRQAAARVRRAGRRVRRRVRRKRAPAALRVQRVGRAAAAHHARRRLLHGVVQVDGGQRVRVPGRDRRRGGRHGVRVQLAVQRAAGRVQLLLLRGRSRRGRARLDRGLQARALRSRASGLLRLLLRLQAAAGGRAAGAACGRSRDGAAAMRHALLLLPAVEHGVARGRRGRRRVHGLLLRRLDRWRERRGHAHGRARRERAWRAALLLLRVLLQLLQLLQLLRLAGARQAGEHVVRPLEVVVVERHGRGGAVVGRGGARAASGAGACAGAGAHRMRAHGAPRRMGAAPRRGRETGPRQRGAPGPGGARAQPRHSALRPGARHAIRAARRRRRAPGALTTSSGAWGSPGPPGAPATPPRGRGGRSAPRPPRPAIAPTWEPLGPTAGRIAAAEGARLGRPRRERGAAGVGREAHRRGARILATRVGRRVQRYAPRGAWGALVSRCLASRRVPCAARPRRGGAIAGRGGLAGGGVWRALVSWAALPKRLGGT
jgi:hypothetical protein